MSQHEHEPTSCAPCLCLCIHSSTVGGCRPATWVLSRHRVLQEELKADIARADDYYRCSFLEHLERHSLCATHCLSCGFHTQSNPVECPHRNDHTASCVECNRAAGLFERMQLLIEKLLAMCTATADPTLEDDVLEWAANINVFEENWRKLVAHLGQVSASAPPALPVYCALMSCVLCAVCYPARSSPRTARTRRRSQTCTIMLLSFRATSSSGCSRPTSARASRSTTRSKRRRAASGSW